MKMPAWVFVLMPALFVRIIRVPPVHKRVSNPVRLVPEPEQPAVVDGAVYHGRRHLVAPEDRALPGELEVGHEDDGLALVGLADHLEEQPRAVGV